MASLTLTLAAGPLFVSNDGPRPHGELFLAGARKPDISAGPVLPLGSEVSGDEHLLTTNHQRDAAVGDPNRPVASSDGYFRFHLVGMAGADGERINTAVAVA